MTQAIGIDLGTTNCCVAYLKEGQVHVVEQDYGLGTFPSVVAEDNGALLLGAKAKQATAPTHRYSFVKRAIGTDQRFAFSQGTFFPFERERADSCSAVEISALYLKVLRERAEQACGEAVRAVITVPAHFGPKHVQETQMAADLARLEVIEIIREPVAAALAWLKADEGNAPRGDLKVLVYDFGGGTMDATVCLRRGGRIEVGGAGSAFDGEQCLGGVDLDKSLVRLAQQALERQGFKPEYDSIGALGEQSWLWALLRTAEMVKQTLSMEQGAEFKREIQVPGSDRSITIAMDVTRAQFERGIEGEVSKTLQCCQKALQKHALHRGNVTLDKEAQSLDAVLLVGGSTRVPLVGRRVKEWLKGLQAEAVPLIPFDPDRAVAIGAAYYASNPFGRTQAASGDIQGDVDIEWALPPSHVKGDVSSHGRIRGKVPVGAAGWRVELRCGNHTQSDDLKDNLEFAFEPFPISLGRNDVSISVKDSSGRSRHESVWVVQRQGETINPGSILSRDIFIRTRREKHLLLRAGASAGAGDTQRFYVGDDSGSVRIPIYEGYVPHPAIEVETKAGLGVPVEIRPEYSNESGRAGIFFTIKVGDEAPSRRRVELTAVSVADPKKDTEQAFMILKETERVLSESPRAKELFGAELEILRNDFETEVTSPTPDPQRISHIKLKLQQLWWGVRAHSSGVDGVLLQLDTIRAMLKARKEKYPELERRVDELQNLAERAEKDDALLAQARQELERLWNDVPVAEREIDKADIEQVVEDIKMRLDKIEQAGSAEQTLSNLRRALDRILSEPSSAAETHRRLHAFRMLHVNEAYRETVMALESRGLLAEG